MITEEEICHQNNNFLDLLHPTLHMLEDEEEGEITRVKRDPNDKGNQTQRLILPRPWNLH